MLNHNTGTQFNICKLHYYNVQMTRWQLLSATTEAKYTQLIQDNNNVIIFVDINTVIYYIMYVGN